MPTTYAHYTFGKTVFRHYPKEIRQLIRKNLRLFQIGLHGPDILFYHKPLSSNPVAKTGIAMHEAAAADFFQPALETLQRFSKAEQEQMLPYLLGFVCHFSLDTICHGYIESKIEKSRVSHSEIEAEFDRMLMEEDGLDPFHFVPTGHIVPSKENALRIARFFPNLTDKQLQKALVSMRFYLRLLVVPHEWKRHVIYTALRLGGHYEESHGLVINREPNPVCIDSNLRLKKLMKKAEPLCIELTQNLLSCLNEGTALDERFSRTFGAGRDWQSIPVLSLEEETDYAP